MQGLCYNEADCVSQLRKINLNQKQNSKVLSLFGHKQRVGPLTKNQTYKQKEKCIMYTSDLVLAHRGRDLVSISFKGLTETLNFLKLNYYPLIKPPGKKTPQFP